MSQRKENRRKEMRLAKEALLSKEDVLYARKIKRDIRNGKLPALMFVRTPDDRLEPSSSRSGMKRVWNQDGTVATLPRGFSLRLVSTFNALVKK